VLRDRYEFTNLDFVELLKRTDALRKWPKTVTSLYVDTGRGFNAEEVRQQTVTSGSSAFALAFDLSDFSGVRGLRWDPVELHHCCVELQRITWRDRGGQSHTLDPAAVSSNGTRNASGGHCFETHDPMFFLPIGEDMASLTLEGCWDIKDIFGTCVRTAHLWETACRQVGEVQQQLGDTQQYIHKQAGEIQARDRHIQALLGHISELQNLLDRTWLSRARSLARRVRARWNKLRRAG
jgi:hypothetical protein